MATAGLALASALPLENNGVNLRVDTSGDQPTKPMSKSKMKRLKARLPHYRKIVEQPAKPKKKSSSLKKLLGSKGRK